MRILFAVSNDNITTSVVNKYQQKYKEIITSKNVYYFNAIIKELQRNKSYDAIVIGEDLEPISNNNYEAVDKFLFEKLDGISDEASKPTGEDIPIIFICSDRRTKSDQLLIKLFGIGIYNAIIGNDRSIDTVCNLINKPRNKKEAKLYYKVESEEITPYEHGDDQDVSETEIQNILSHYRKIGANIKKCVESFDSIADQYNETQLRVIVNFLPTEVKDILGENSARYQKLMSNGTVLSDGSYAPYNRQNARVPEKLDVLTKDIGKTNLSTPVIIPSTININKNQAKGQIPNTLQRNSNSMQVNQIPQIRQTPTMPMQQVQNSAQTINQGQGVNRKEMEPIANNNQNIANQEQKRGRGRPKKVQQVPTSVNNQAVGQMQGLENINPLAAENNNMPQNVPTASVAANEQKRGRGRPSKKVATPMPVQNVSQPTPQENNANSNNDVLPGLEEFASGGTEDLFGISPVDTSTQEPITGAVLPGFENDMENMTGDMSTLDSDTNLFDLDLEETAPMQNEPQNMQNNNFDDMLGEDIFNSNMNDMNNMNNASYDNNQAASQATVPNNQGEVNNNEVSPFDLGNDFNNPYGNTNGYDMQNNFVGSDPYGNMNQNQMNSQYANNGFNANQTMNSQMQPMQQMQYVQNPNQAQFGGMQANTLTNTNQAASYGNNVLAGNGKIALFVGTTKNGTSFIVNNLAQLLSQTGVRTAVLDLTKNKNSYYMFTDNDPNLMKKATESIKNLSNGVVDGLNVNKNLTVFTSLPDGMEEENVDVMLRTLSNNFDIALLDCDFETNVEYFTKVNEIYLIQSMDTFTIQPLTQFLSDLKLKNMLDESKLRIVINKHVRLRKLDERMIIGGMSKYNEPSMTLQRDLFNAQTIKYVCIPFEMETYARYLESIAMCSLSLNGYSQNFLNGLEELKNMIYPLIPGAGSKGEAQGRTEEKRGLFGGKKNKQNQTTQFSSNVNDTLNRMRTNNF